VISRRYYFRLARYLLIRNTELSPQPLVAYCVFCTHLPFGFDVQPVWNLLF
jgi:hypothetical protein